MCNNCMTYNQPETIYFKAAKKLLAAGQKIMGKVIINVLFDQYFVKPNKTVRKIISLRNQVKNINHASQLLACSLTFFSVVSSSFLPTCGGNKNIFTFDLLI